MGQNVFPVYDESMEYGVSRLNIQRKLSVQFTRVTSLGHRDVVCGFRRRGDGCTSVSGTYHLKGIVEL